MDKQEKQKEVYDEEFERFYLNITMETTMSIKPFRSKDKALFLQDEAKIPKREEFDKVVDLW